jgi:hypothetical protein
MRLARWSVLMLSGLTLSACAAPRAVPPPPAPPAPVAPAPSCLDALAARGAVFAPAMVPTARRGCALTDGVSLGTAGAVLEPPAVVNCPLALVLADFEARVIQPAAMRHLGGKVATIRQIGAYSCRTRSGGSGQLSHHAAGLAIDIAGFDMEDGSRVLVKRHWRDPGPRGRFLREVARAACDAFSVVLTPSHDVWHADHLHLDIGRDRLCGM